MEPIDEQTEAEREADSYINSGDDEGGDNEDTEVPLTRKRSGKEVMGHASNVFTESELRHE